MMCYLSYILSLMAIDLWKMHDLGSSHLILPLSLCYTNNLVFHHHLLSQKQEKSSVVMVVTIWELK